MWCVLDSLCGGKLNMKEKEEKKADEREQCFVMMPFSDQGDYPKGHFDKIYDQIFKPAIEKAGYQAYRVDENSSSVWITEKIFKAIQESPMALCDLSNQNPNVLYELGLRQAYDKPVVLVQDEKTDKIFDVSGISTVFYESNRLYENVFDAREKITKAILDTKQGRYNSIVKVMKAHAAPVSTGDMTLEDKLEIMLSGIIDDIKEIKTDRSWGTKNHILSPNVPLTKYYNSSGMYSIKLKQGVTNTQIKFKLREIEEKYNGIIKYEREGQWLYFESSDIPPFLMGDVLGDIINSLGE